MEWDKLSPVWRSKFIHRHWVMFVSCMYRSITNCAYYFSPISCCMNFACLNVLCWLNNCWNRSSCPLRILDREAVLVRWRSIRLLTNPMSLSRKISGPAPGYCNHEAFSLLSNISRSVRFALPNDLEINSNPRVLFMNFETFSTWLSNYWGSFELWICSGWLFLSSEHWEIIVKIILPSSIFVRNRK